MDNSIWLQTLLFAEDGDSLVVRVVSGPLSEQMRHAAWGPDSLPAMVVARNEPVSVEDVAADQRASGPQLPAGAELEPAILVPIRTGSDTHGVLALAWTHEHSDRYHRVDAALPASFAEQATLALNLAQAYDDRQRLAVFEDRDRIGRDLHDVVIQRLFAVGLSLQGAARKVEHPETAQRMERAVDDLDATVKAIRRSIFALGTSEQSGDIESEVTRLVDRARTSLKFLPQLEFDGPVRTLITGDVAEDVLAVLGELLSNASRHADPSKVDVRLKVDSTIELSVADDGRGLPAEVAESGLANIRQRAERRGGHCVVESTPGEGTKVTWSVPLTPRR